MILYLNKQEIKIGTFMKKYKESENKEVKEAAEDLINKWKSIIHKQNEPPKKEVEKNKPVINIEDYLLEEDKSTKKRNNTRKNLYKYLEPNLKDKENEEEHKKLMEKIVEIEEKLYETIKGEAPYVNRVLEILHNLKDKENDKFKNDIINGTIKPEDLCTMDANEMLDKSKQQEREKEKKQKVEEISSDWQEKHGDVTEGVYKCKKCGGKKTVQRELQTRSADEPMTVFITCVECKNTWKI